MKKLISIASMVLLGATAQAVDFAKDVAPILELHCVKCHGEKKQKGEYRLDNAKDIVKPGESEKKPIVAGDPAASHMVKLISLTKDDDEVMPPKGGPLAKEEVETIKQWIKDGAKFPEGLTLQDKSPKQEKK